MTYDAVNTKLRAMSGRLLGLEDYQRLASRANVADFADQLTALPDYTRALAGIGGSASRGAIEQHITLSLVRDFEKLYTFIGDYDVRQYLDAFFMRFQVDVLKAMLCAVFDDRREAFGVPGVIAFMTKKLKVDAQRLLNSENVTAFIANLKDTPYYHVLVKRYAEGKTTLFELETMLDVYYYTQLWKMLDTLDKRNRPVLRELAGTEIDVRNIQWIYRLKTYYHIEAERIYSYLAPVRHRLSRAMVTKIVEAKSPEDLLAAISETPYFKGFDGRHAIEAAAAGLMNRAHKKARKEHPRTLASVAAFLHFKEMEIGNVVSLLECVRYSMKPEDAMAYVVIGDEPVR